MIQAALRQLVTHNIFSFSPPRSRLLTVLPHCTNPFVLRWNFFLQLLYINLQSEEPLWFVLQMYLWVRLFPHKTYGGNNLQPVECFRDEK